jgi:cell division transport system permease protein
VIRAAARLAWFARSALRGIAGSPATSLVAVATIAVTLVLSGTFLLLVSNMERLLDEFGESLQITAFLSAEAGPEQRERLRALAAAQDGVASVRVVTPEEALLRFRRGVGRGAALLDGLSENPLPASLEITLAEDHRSASGLSRVADALRGEPGIEDLASGQDWVEGYLRAVSLVRAIGWGLAAILAAATLLIVANTIRLGVLSRRDELEILALVGASRSFVNVPFLLEGLLQGAAGGAIALLILYALFRLVLPGFELGLEVLLGGVAPRFFAAGESAALVGAGAALGLFGAGAALASESRP